MKYKLPYHPVSCDFHSELELLALRRTVCPIRYRNEAGEEVTVESSIEDLYTRNSEEFLVLKNGNPIRLDQLVSVNGILLKDYC